MPIRQTIKQRFKARAIGQSPDAQGLQSSSTHHTLVDPSSRPTSNPSLPSSNTAVIPTRGAEACTPSSNASRGSRSTGLWATALESLSVEHRAVLNNQALQQPSLNTVDHLCALSQQKRTECENRGWKIEFNEHRVILRDVAEKVLVWLHKFKEIGDVVVNYDPVHLALPWAGIRFLLQVGMPLTPNKHL